MSDPAMSKAGPAIATEIDEVHAVFASDAAMQEAVARLTQAGFDRADLSLPAASPAMATPEQGADTVTTDADMRQARTLGTSLAGSAGALAAAGITIATGGAALLAVGAAAAVGAGAAVLAGAAGGAAKDIQHTERENAAARGELLLSVRTPDARKAELATELLQAAGATRVEAITRTRG